MKIMLFGVACVGTSTVGKLLAAQLGYKFFDFGQEVEAYFNSHITFLQEKWWTGHEYRKNTRVVLQKILAENADDFVIAMSPSGLMDFYWRIIQKDESLVTIVLRDRAENILKRLTFYDDYSEPMESPVNEDNEHHYLESIRADMEYFGRSFARAKYQHRIDGKGVAEVADALLALVTDREG